MSLFDIERDMELARNPPSRLPITSNAIARVDVALNLLRKKLGPADAEELYIIGSDGQLRLHKKGDRDHVRVDNLPLSVTLHAIIIHQHTGAVSFPPSSSDLAKGLLGGARFQLVVSKDGIHRVSFKHFSLFDGRFESLLSQIKEIPSRLGELGPPPENPIERRAYDRREAVLVASYIRELSTMYPGFLSYRRFAFETPGARLLLGRPARPTGAGRK